MVFAIPIFLVLMITFFLFQKLPEVLISTNESEAKLLKSFQFDKEKENIQHYLQKIKFGMNANYELIYNDSKKILETEVENAYKIVTSIYSLKKSKEESIKIIQASLKSIRYFNSKGYFVIFDGNYNNILEPVKKEEEGKNFKDWIDANGKKSIYNLINEVKKRGFTWKEIYYKNQNKLQKKIVYAKYFEPLDIVITSSLYDTNLQQKFLYLLVNRFKYEDGVYIMQKDKLLVGNKSINSMKNNLVQEANNVYISKNQDSILIIDKIEKFGIDLDIVIFRSLADLQKTIFIQQSEMNRMFNKLRLEIISAVFIITSFSIFLALLLSMFLTKHIKNYVNKINDLNKKLQEKITITTKENEKSNELFRGVFHFIPNFMVLFDAKFKYLNINQAYRDIFGVQKDEVIGKDIGVQKIIKDVEAFKELKRRILVHGEVLDYEYEAYTKEHKSALFSISVKKIEINDVIYYILVGREITSYKELLNKYETLNIDLEKRVQNELLRNKQQQEMLLMQSRFATMGEMISMIAHQWRQPLNVLSLIMVNINLQLEFNSLEKEFLKEQMEKADKTIKHMSATIDDFKNLLSKDIKSKVVILKDVVDKAISIIMPQLTAHTIFLKLDCEQKIEVYLNDSELTQVILNIIANAKDAILEKNIEQSNLYVYSTTEEIESVEYVTLSIEDEAGGIDEDIIDNIFDPYFSTKGKNGTGIGLYMSKLIVEKYQGILSVENSKKGIKMDIKLPVYKTIERDIK
jgi:PAS domain S-box-containing protein